MKIGDYVFPAYDGKMLRITACKVIAVGENTVTIQGVFWGDDEKNNLTVEFKNEPESEDVLARWQAWVKYNPASSTLMDLLQISDDEQGDFYRLYTLEDYSVPNLDFDYTEYPLNLINHEHN